MVGWISGYVKLFCLVMLILLLSFLYFIICLFFVLLYFVTKSIEFCLPQALATVNIKSK